MENEEFARILREKLKEYKVMDRLDALGSLKDRMSAAIKSGNQEEIKKLTEELKNSSILIPTFYEYILFYFTMAIVIIVFGEHFVYHCLMFAIIQVNLVMVLMFF